MDFYTVFQYVAVCFLWLSLPGDYRVTDEALLAETTWYGPPSFLWMFPLLLKDLISDFIFHYCFFLINWLTSVHFSNWSACCFYPPECQLLEKKGVCFVCCFCVAVCVCVCVCLFSLFAFYLFGGSGVCLSKHGSEKTGGLEVSSV